MPELPDVVVYVESLERTIVDRRLDRVRLLSPFVLRSVEVPITQLDGRRVVDVERLGKRLVLAFEGELFAVIHLMIAGRLRWRRPGAGAPGKAGLALFDFEHGTLVFTEASTRKRAALHVVAGRQAVATFDRGGLEPLEIDVEAFAEVLRSENHTIKRSLTDPRLLSGIGNAYSDEILHRARLSPFRQTRQLSDAEIATLHAAMQETLRQWIETLRAASRDRFPDKVTAFREGMAVHGRYGQPCPDCGTPVQRIQYADNEANYCTQCQTGGRLLADRGLSRLLKQDWPRTLEELENTKARQREPE